MSDIKSVLKERGEQYGDFQSFSDLYWRLMQAALTGRSHAALSGPRKLAVRQIIFKLCRLLNGGGDQSDTWTDIAGYATLGRDSHE